MVIKNTYHKFIFGRYSSPYSTSFSSSGIKALLPWAMRVQSMDAVIIESSTSRKKDYLAVEVRTEDYLLSHSAQERDGTIAEVDSVMWTLIKANLRKKGKSLGEIVSVETNVHVPNSDREYKVVNPDGLGECLNGIYTNFNLGNEFNSFFKGKEVPPVHIEYDISQGGSIIVKPADVKNAPKPQLYLFSIGTLAMAQMALLSGIFSYGEEGSNKERLESKLEEEGKTVDWNTCKLTGINSKEIVVSVNEAEEKNEPIKLVIPMPHIYVPPEERVKVNYVNSFEL